MTMPVKRLSRMILDFDEENPGEVEAAVEIPFEVWAEMVDLAGQVDEEED
jgi:hypothetical protein